MNGLMKKAGLGIALAASALTAVAPADAQRFGGGHGGGFHGGGYRGGYGGYHRGGYAGAAVLGGLVGLGVGAAVASRPYYGYGYGPGYYGPAYYGGYYAPRCWTRWHWDPYWGRNVPVQVCN